GTKKQSQEPIENAANGCGMPYVNFRWLGGMLTNFQTVHSRVAKLREFQRQVDSGEVDLMSKKEGLKVRRDLAKLERNLGGIKNLEKLPSAVFIIDTKKEHIAVTEANRLRIPVVAIVDTNCDPDIIDYVIPGNDDAIRSAQLMCRVISDAVVEGREIARRRGARAGTRSEDVAPPAPAKPQRTTEEQAEFDRRQAEARDAAAAKQREIEERARLAKEASKSAPAAEASPATDAAPAEEASTPPSAVATAEEPTETAAPEPGESSEG
ncbi:MAG: small subunit ribosomal protein, partial [Actinomycetota bacterium]|nr:small subunit ribosomal protein [Actinomycetota bacterium]